MLEVSMRYDEIKTVSSAAEQTQNTSYHQKKHEIMRRRRYEKAYYLFCETRTERSVEV